MKRYGHLRYIAIVELLLSIMFFNYFKFEMIDSVMGASALWLLLVSITLLIDRFVIVKAKVLGD